MRIVLCLGILLLSGTRAAAQFTPLQQTLPRGFEQTRGNAAVLSGPAVPGAARWQWHYDASNFIATGRILIREVWIRPADPRLAWPGVQRADFEVLLATASRDYRLPARHPLFDLNIQSATFGRGGPLSLPPAPAPRAPGRAWIPLGIRYPMLYDPSSGSDFIVDIRQCTPSHGLLLPPLDGVGGPTGTALGNTYGAVGSCTEAIPNQFSDEEVPIIRIEYIPIDGFEYETNGPAASLTIDEREGTPYEPAISQRCTGAPFALRLQSGLVTPGFEVLVGFARPTRRSLGAPSSPNGQILHPPIGGAPATFVFGGTLPRFDLASLPAAGLNIPLSLGSTGEVMAQLAVIDPTHPDGLSLSQAAAVESVPVPFPVELPLSDDDAREVLFGAPTTCGPGLFRFYGRIYSKMFVTSNGRITFDVGDGLADVSVLSALAGPPMIGGWTDLDPTAAGGVLATSPASDVVRVRWSGLLSPRSPGSTGTPNTLEVDLFATTGEIEIRWIDFGGQGRPFQPFVLGISPGYFGPATDPGSQLFGLPGQQAAGFRASDALYQVGNLVQPPSTVGLGVRFVPELNQGYRWFSF